MIEGTVHTIAIHNVSFIADPVGALYWPEQQMLVVADLHLEKGSSFARRGLLLPPYDSGATLHNLSKLITRYAPQRVIALGDSFHDRSGSARMTAPDRETLELIAAWARLDLDCRQSRSRAAGDRWHFCSGACYGWARVPA